MRNLDLQSYVEGLAMKDQRERAKTQMTLGGLIWELEAMPEGAVIANLSGMHSFRGYYYDLALSKGEGTRAPAELLAECKAAMGRVFEGYKGGDFLMGESTPIWISERGSGDGDKLIALNPDGTLTTEEDSY